MKKITKAITIKWMADDIIEAGKRRGLLLTGYQAGFILDMLKRQHDATIGINWDVINATIDNYFFTNI